MGIRPTVVIAISFKASEEDIETLESYLDVLGDQSIDYFTPEYDYDNPVLVGIIGDWDVDMQLEDFAEAERKAKDFAVEVLTELDKLKPDNRITTETFFTTINF